MGRVAVQAHLLLIWVPQNNRNLGGTGLELPLHLLGCAKVMLVDQAVRCWLLLRRPGSRALCTSNAKVSGCHIQKQRLMGLPPHARVAALRLHECPLVKGARPGPLRCFVLKPCRPVCSQCRPQQTYNKLGLRTGEQAEPDVLL